MGKRFAKARSFFLLPRKPAGGVWELYLVPAGVGVFLYVVFFLYCLAAHSGFSLMGVSDPELSRLARTYLVSPFVLFELKVLAAYVAIGGGLGVFAGSALRGTRRGEKKIGHLKRGLLTAALLLVFHSLVFARAVTLYPQLFTEFLYEKGGFWKELQIALTDRIGLAPVRVVLWVVFTIAAASAVSGICRSLRQGGRRVLKRRVAVLSFFFVLALAVVALPQRRPGRHVNQGPNLLLLVADSIRPDLLSVYGHPRDTSPTLARLAEKGVRFEEVYTQLPRTFPAWVTLFTGLYPFQHGITTMFPSVAERQKNFYALPRILRDHGWATVVVSDYAGDIFPRINLGFQEISAPDFNFNTLALMRGLEIHTHLLPYLANPWGRELFPVLKEFAGFGNPAFVAREVKSRLRRLAGREKFMLTVFFSATHFPYSPHWPYYRRYTDPAYRGRSKYSKFNRINVEEKLSAEDINQVRAVFEGAIRATDDAIGEIMETLEEEGLAQNTIVVFLSDHGENLYEDEYEMGHGDHLRGRYSLRIPLLLFDPRNTFGEKVIRPRVRMMDLFPTILELLGLPVPAGLPARSMMPLLTGLEKDPDLPVYAETGLWFVRGGPGFFQKERLPYPDVTRLCWFEEYFNHEIVRRGEWEAFTEVAKHRMVIKGRWKIIYVPLPGGVKYELYDLAADPEEREDLAGKRPAELAAMKAELRQILLLRPGWEFAGDYFVPEEAP